MRAPGSNNGKSGPIAFIAHKPGTAGTYTIGACIRAEPTVSVQIDSPTLASAPVQILE